MEKQQNRQVELRYRLATGAIAPRNSKLSIPGWSGDAVPMSDGSIAQPWHCMPFQSAAVYGVELLYWLQDECHVVNEAGSIVFYGNFGVATEATMAWPPFRASTENHFTFNCGVDLRAPAGYVLRIEPHPRFFTDLTGTVPVAVAGHLESSWWPMFFFTTFKNPPPGGSSIFRFGEPFAQVIAVPKQDAYVLNKMDDEEASERGKQAEALTEGRGNLARNVWFDRNGTRFDDRYKVLSRLR